MPNKIIKNFRDTSFLRFILATISFTSRKLFGLYILVYPTIEGGKIAKKIFSKRSIKDSGLGYYFVDPMPTKKELNCYYESAYWGSRSGKHYSAYGRDFRHFLILQKFLLNTFKFDQINFLNFGAGHGGISYILHLLGSNIFNIEPSGMPNSFEKNWNWAADLESIQNDSIDLLYASHSLEHVNDIYEFIKHAKRVLKKNGYMFVEVPNARCPNDLRNIKRNKIDIPHTYYFTVDYFDYIFDFILLNKSFNQPFYSGDFDLWENYEAPDGAVICSLGQLRRD